MAISVATLISNAKLLADKRGDSSIADVDWATLVNWGVKSLYRFIVGLDPEFYFAQADFTLLSTPAGAAKDLSSLTWAPTGVFQAIYGLDLNPDLPQRMTVPSRNFRERNRPAIGWWRPSALVMDRAYDMRARTLVITPFERAAGSYRAYARLLPYLFTSDVDATALDFQLEPYDEYIVIMAARKGLGIEESDAGLQSERLAELRQEITDEHTRDNGAPAVIADVEADGPSW